MALFEEERWSKKIYVNGWREGGGEPLEVFEPATGESLGHIGMASVADVLEASRSALEAQRAWAKKTPADRAAVLRKAGELWQEHADEVIGWLVRESGSVGFKAGMEVNVAAEECFEASALPSHPHGEVLTSNEDRWSIARRTPSGVVSVIAPFNFPLVLGIRSVAPALALGNAVLLKPDPRTTVSAGVSIMRIFEEAGLPAGVLQLLPGGGDIGEALVTAPEVSIVSFTGSTNAGKAVGQLAATHLKRAHLELGGNNALLVLPGADIEKASAAGAFGSFMHQGQICMTSGRHLVHESQYEEYVAALSARAKKLPYGNPATEQVILGPIIDKKQLDRVQGIVDAAVAEGANIAAGGKADGPFFPPTVLTHIKDDNPAFTTEIFGPVAPVLSYSTLDEAVRIINESEYGLSIGILGDVGLAMQAADKIEAGKIHINDQTVSDEPNAPMGGVKASGTGARFGGPAANIDAFTDVQWVTVKPEIGPYPF